MIFLKCTETLDDYYRGKAWDAYYDALATLDTLAPQQQVMTREAFDEQMLDKAFEKELLLDEDGLVQGLASSTRDMNKVSLVSNRRLEVEFPPAYKSGNIWYVTFVAIPGSAEGAFVTLMDHMFDQAAGVDGVIAYDACDYNVFGLEVGFARAIEAYTIKRSRGKCSSIMLGAQYYIAMDVNGAYGEQERRLPNGMGVRKNRPEVTA